MSPAAEEIDYVVIGAGWFGLACARIWHELHPSDTLAVLDSGSTPGGVWAAERLFPGLRTNNLLGPYQYPDFPMDPAVFGVKPGEHIPGEVVYAYLNAYAERFGIRESIRCGWRVDEVEDCGGDDGEGGWVLSCEVTGTDGDWDVEKKKRIRARRLVVATGLTCVPSTPRFEGQGDFGGPVFHNMSALGDQKALDAMENVTVVGAGKSGWDAVYNCATRGVSVDWVISENGRGPVWMSPSRVTPFKIWLEKLAVTRVLTWFSPCIWGRADGYPLVRTLLHSTRIGRAVVDLFWSVVAADVRGLVALDSHPELAKLKPRTDLMGVGTSFSILNYPTDFFDLVRAGTVRIHVGELTRLSRGKAHLADGTVLRSDAVCVATGWRPAPAFRFLPEGTDRVLGLPHVVSDPSAEPLLTPTRLARADAEILARFPRLQTPPSSPEAYNRQQQLTPWTLHRFVAPADAAQVRSRRDVAFAGMVACFNTSVVAHAQALWIAAYFDRRIVAPGPVVSDGEMEDLRYETVLHSRFGKFRYPGGRGAQYPDFIFDAVPYLDLLLRDLGLNPRRKGGWLADVFRPYASEDYEGILEEWRAKNKD